MPPKNRSRPVRSAVREDIDETLEDNVRLQDMAGEALDACDQLHIARNGRVYDLIVPILVLIIFSILGMMYAGGFFQGIDFATAMGENPIMGLCIGSVVALVVAALLYLPRKLLNLSSFITGASEGVRSMVEAIMILVLAWSLGGCCRYMLGTGTFIAGLLDSAGFALQFLPVVIFIASAFIGFAMGYFLGNDRACDPDRDRRVHTRKPASTCSRSAQRLPARSMAIISRPFRTQRSSRLPAQAVIIWRTLPRSCLTRAWWQAFAWLDILLQG